MESKALKEIKCPSCCGSMTHGYIAGHWIRLRWTKMEKTYTIFAGDNMRRKITWSSAPTIEAVRCEECKIGIFRYDY